VGGIGALEMGEWEHIGLSFDGTDCTLYRNGDAVGSGAYSLGPDTQAALVFGCCQAAGGNPYNGALDEVRLYNRPLSAEEVAWLAGRTLPFSTAPDLNVDGTVNFGDYNVIADAWLDEMLWPAP
jgi:hypothetical protein